MIIKIIRNFSTGLVNGSENSKMFNNNITLIFCNQIYEMDCSVYKIKIELVFLI